MVDFWTKNRNIQALVASSEDTLGYGPGEVIARRHLRLHQHRLIGAGVSMTGDMVVSASDFREKSADILESVDRGRVLVRKHGEDRAYLISVRELRALEETIAVLENQGLAQSIARGLEDIGAGRVEEASDAFAELDAEFQNEE